MAHERQPYSGIYATFMFEQLTGGDVLAAHMMLLATATSFARADATARLCDQDLIVLDMVSRAIAKEIAALTAGIKRRYSHA